VIKEATRRSVRLAFDSHQRTVTTDLFMSRPADMGSHAGALQALGLLVRLR